MLNLTLSQKAVLSQKLVMVPQMQQAVKMLQMSQLELQQCLAEEMEMNPLLEEGSEEAPDETTTETWEQEMCKTQDAESDPNQEGSEIEKILEAFAYQWDENNEFGDEEAPAEQEQGQEQHYDPTSSHFASLSDYLLWQLRLSSLSDAEKRLGAALIDQLDERGYLSVDFHSLAAELGVSVETLEPILQVIQEFDPPGIAARDLVECLCIQLRQKGQSGSLAETIVKRHFGDLQKKAYTKMAQVLGVAVEEVIGACKTISGLEPIPARPFSTPHNIDIVPDIYVERSEDGAYTVRLNREVTPALRISAPYKALLRSPHRLDAPTRAFLKKKLQSAIWMIKNIEQRNHTIYRVALCIVQFQSVFFERGPGHLRPLILKDVASALSLHPSTISRATTEKYMHTPYGILELKAFFSNRFESAASGREEGASSDAVGRIIRALIAEEDIRMPLTDQEIVAAMQKKNIKIARRTVSKYRDLLHIKAARLRHPPAEVT